MHEAQRLVRSYGLSLTVTALAFLLTLLFWSLSQRLPFALCLSAVLVSAFVRGPVWGMATTLLAAALLVSIYNFVPVWNSPEPATDYMVRLVMFLLVGLLGCYLSSVCRRAVFALDGVHEALAGAGSALVFADNEHRVTYLNAQAQTLILQPDAEAVGVPLPQLVTLIDEKTRRPRELPVDQAQRDGQPVDLGEGLLMVSRAGGETPVEGALIPIHESDERQPGLALSLRNVASRRSIDNALQARMLKLEESLRETQAELDEALQAHDQALAGQELADDALRQARAEFEQRFHEHAGAHAEALDKLRMAEAEVERHKADREEAQTRSENTVQSLRSDYERRLRQESSLREKAEQDLTNANAQWERRLAEKTDALARVEESLRLTRAELDHHSAQSQQEQRRIEEALRSETAELKRQLSEHQTARGQADEALRQTCASFERELEERTRSHVSAHDALRDEIARRRDAEDKIRAAHELLEGIVQNHADALFAFDREGRITLWNPAMEEITGLSSAEVVGQPFTDVLAVLGQQDGSQLVADTLIGKNASAAFGPFPGALAGGPGWQGELSPLWGPAHEIKGGTGTLRMLATPLPTDQESNAALMREDPAEDAHDPEGPGFRPPHQSSPLAQQEHHSRWLSFN